MNNRVNEKLKIIFWILNKFSSVFTNQPKNPMNVPEENNVPATENNVPESNNDVGENPDNNVPANAVPAETNVPAEEIQLTGEQAAIFDEIKKGIAKILNLENISDERLMSFLQFTTGDSWAKFEKNCATQEEILLKKIAGAFSAIKNPVNGKKNEAYAQTPIAVPAEIVEKVDDITVVPANENCGIEIHFDKTAGTLIFTGTPKLAGTFEYEISFTLKGFRDNELRGNADKKLSIFINQDPREMWRKNIPTPAEIEYYKPDSDTKSIFCGNANLRIVGASQRGRSHAIEGKARDDDFAIDFDEISGWTTIVVADGAGSAKYSREGSKIACKKVVEECQKRFYGNDEIEAKIARVGGIPAGTPERTEPTRELYNACYQELVETAKAARDAIAAEVANAKEQPARLKDFSTTLLVAVFKNFEFGKFIATFWVGDGALTIYNNETPFLRIMGVPDGGEFSGQTRFLTMPEVLADKDLHKRVNIAIRPKNDALILMTDGVSDPKFETDARLNEIACWQDLWKQLTQSYVDEDDGTMREPVLQNDVPANNERAHDGEVDGNSENNVPESEICVPEKSENRVPAAEARLLKWLDFWSKGNHDDRTIVISY